MNFLRYTNLSVGVTLWFSGCHSPGGVIPTTESGSSDATGLESSTRTTGDLTTGGTASGTSSEGSANPTSEDTTDSTTEGPAIGCTPSPWPDGYPEVFRKRIGFKVSKNNLTESLPDFPLLVVLPPSIDGTTFTDETTGKILFTDAQGSTLSHEFEETPPVPQGTVDPTCDDRARNVWVKTTLENDEDTCLYMYFDREDLKPDNMVDPADVWSAGFKYVWHINSGPGDSFKNSRLPNGDDVVECVQGSSQVECYNDATDQQPWPTACLNGSACRNVSGFGDHIGLNLVDDFSGPMTVSFWWNRWNTDADGDAQIAFGALTVSSSNCPSTHPCRDAETVQDGNFYFGIADDVYFGGVYDGSAADKLIPPGDYAMKDWHNIAITRDADNQLDFCVDGQCYEGSTVPMSSIGAICLGGDWHGDKVPSMSTGVVGSNSIYLVDEIQMSDLVRTEAWLRASYLNRWCPGVFGQESDCAFIEFSPSVENRP